MEFLKAEGLGNDFVIIEGQAPTVDQIRSWCDRKTGIGADGVMRVTGTGDLDGSVARMQYWNSDGSPAGMCGNGLRCVALYVYERGWSKQQRRFTVRTPTGSNRVEVLDDRRIKVELGAYRVGSDVMVGDRLFATVDVGNPHAVTFVEDASQLDSAPLRSVGVSLQGHPRFPDGVNVEFALKQADGYRMRVWERGVGETSACGTGAAAVVAAGFREGRDGSDVDVELAGGTLSVSLLDGIAWIQGPAVLVFVGTLFGSIAGKKSPGVRAFVER